MQAVSAHDDDALRGLFADDVDFRALTPGRVWEAATPHEVSAVVLDRWFRAEYSPVLRSTQSGRIGDRSYVSYRIGVTREAAAEELEQHAFLTCVDGRIVWMRVLCSGYCASADQAT